MDLLKKIGFMKRVRMHKRRGGVCLSIAWKGLVIIGIEDIGIISQLKNLGEIHSIF